MTPTPEELVRLLEQLGDLRERSVLSDEEFAAQKARLLAPPDNGGATPTQATPAEELPDWVGEALYETSQSPLRTTPGYGGRLITIIDHLTVVLGLERRGEFMRVQAPSGYSGWTNLKTLSPLATLPEWAEASGETIQQAQDRAMWGLGVSTLSDASFEVLQRPRTSGLFRLPREAIVRAHRTVDHFTYRPSPPPPESPPPVPPMRQAAAVPPPVPPMRQSAAAPPPVPKKQMVLVPPGMHAMPDLSGQGLKWAMQAYSHIRFRLSDVAFQDASGAGRRPWADPFAWTVVSQTPSPGTPVARGTQVVLYCLKHGEVSSYRT